MPLVALTYIHYPVSIGHYFRKAFERQPDVELVTAGPACGQWIPWNGGMTLPYIDEPDIATPPGRLPIAFVEEQIRARCGRNPDLYVQVDADYCFDGKPARAKNFIVATDAHVANYDYQRSVADTFFNMHKHYSKPGDVWLPYCADPVYNARLPSTDAEYDVCLVGRFYPNRQNIAERLYAKGIKVCLAFGPCFNDAREVYAKTIIGWNDPLHDDLNMRSFELKYMGLPVVERWVPDLFDVFGENDTLAYRSDEECVEKIAWLLEHPAERHAIASSGNLAAQPHTYDARVREILSYL